MGIKLGRHQLEAAKKLSSGSILNGGVGSGKSLTALYYYFHHVCKGEMPEDNKEQVYKKMKKPKDLYIITTARKRDTLDWEGEGNYLLISKHNEDTPLVVDSWNNLHKYTEVSGAFFILDEQRLVGSGAWVKAFYKIAKNNDWLLLSATPGDTWSDYIPVFVANGFFKNKTEFIRKHAVFNTWSKYPKIERYVDTGILVYYKNKITVTMPFKKHTIPHNKMVMVSFDKEKFNRLHKDRWNIYEDKPIGDVAELCRLMRKLVNSDSTRIEATRKLANEKKRVIIFYNFDYELELLRKLDVDNETEIAEWNGHKHEPLPTSEKWVYLVQYTAGSEGWNCVDTDTIIFYSASYSYKAMAQAAGRIDRLNTPYTDLYYYKLWSNSWIDKRIYETLAKKKSFQEKSIKFA